MADTYRLLFPLPPNLGNGRMHHFKKARLEKAYGLQGLVVVYNARLKNVGFEHVTVTPTLYLANRMDADNAVARLKWALDVLVDQGVIPDDSPKHLTLHLTGPGGGPEQIIRRAKAAQGLALEITPGPAPNLDVSSSEGASIVRP